MAVGVVACSLVVLASRRALPSLEGIRSAPWWAWVCGGILGTIYLNGYLYLVPRLGAAGLVSCIIAGQLTFAVIADRYGWFSFPQQGVSVARILGCVLIVAGAALVLRRAS
jgi:transporter family-2 protein